MVRIYVKSSKKYSRGFVKALEESARDIVEGRVGDFSDLAREYGVEVKPVAKTRLNA